MDSSEQNIVLKFGTEPNTNEVDALAVASAIEAVATMIKEVHQGFHDNHELLVKARPFAPGSLEIPLDIVVSAAVAASLVNQDVISDILNIVKEYFKIKNSLKGEVPRIENGKIIIEGNAIKADNITINILQPSSFANQLVSKAMDKASCDDSIRAIEIIKDSEQKKIARVDKSQFQYYHKIETTVETPQEECRKERTTLVIYGPILAADNRVMWKFIRAKDRETFSANITDETFLSRVASGEKFAAGDMLEVELLIRQKHDKMFETYVDLKKGTITEVFNHIPRDEQTQFGYDESD